MKTLKTIEEEFDKIFIDINCPGFGEHTEKCNELREIKSFYQKQIEKLLKEIEFINTVEEIKSRIEIILK